MITFCAIPKPFEGLYERLQHNAIKGWLTVLSPNQIVLVGDDFGVADVARAYGCRHVSCQVNDFGTPVLSDVFARVAEVAETPYLGFVNADILIDPRVTDVLQVVMATFSKGFLGVARRWNMDVDTWLDFSSPACFVELKHQAHLKGDLYPPVGMDFFVFPKHLFDDMPPFSIGWPGAKYDNWMIWYARSVQMPVVDMTNGFTLIHQNHPGGSGADPDRYVEHWRNLRFCGGYGHCYDIYDATHVLTSDMAFRKPSPQKTGVLWRRRIQRCRDLWRFELL